MKSLRAALFLAILAAACGNVANADSVAPTNPSSGTPLSGEVPILYNDHTVYAKPDLLRGRRVLAAFIKNHQIYVPLRSMFEQMGASVEASADGKTFIARKSRTTVSVRLGSSDVTIDGETRRLDVPPMLYRGVVLVPVRVISEALGAYVLWVSEKRLVVVRYVPPPSPPAPVAVPVTVPTLAPSPVPTPNATPVSVATPYYPGYIEVAAWAARSYNEFSDGKYCPDSYLSSAAYAFKNSPFAVKVDYRLDSYVTSDNLTDALKNHYTRFATIDGGTALTPVFLARQSNVDERLEYQVAAPRIYVGLGDIQTANDYGYPRLSGIGFGIEKLPDFRTAINLSGSAFYYPSASGNYTVTNAASSNAGKVYQQQYAIVKYDVGVSVVIARSPIYLHVGYSGDRYLAKSNAPIGQTHAGPYIGLGAKF